MDLSRVKRAQDNGDYYLIDHADHGAIVVPKSKLTPEGDAVVQQMCNGGLAGYDGDDAKDDPSSQVVPDDAGRRNAENSHQMSDEEAAKQSASDEETLNKADATTGAPGGAYVPPTAATTTITHPDGTTITHTSGAPTPPADQIEEAVPQVSPEEPLPGKPAFGFNPVTALAGQFAPTAASTPGEPAPALQQAPAPALSGPTTPPAPPEKLPVGPPQPPTLVPNQSGINLPGNFNFDQNALTKKSGLAQEQGVIEEQARRDLKTQNDYLTLQKALISGRDATLAGFDQKQQALNALAAKPIQPFQLFADVPFTNSDGSPMLDSEGKQRHGVQWQNVLGAIGLALGTFGAAWSKTPNYAVKVYQDAIDNDLKAQEQNQANARQLANMNVQQRQQYLQEYDLRKIDATDRVSALLKGSAAQAAGPLAAARLLQQASDIDAQNQINKINYADKQMSLRATNLEYQKNVIGLTSPDGIIAQQNAANEGFGSPTRFAFNPATGNIDQYKVAGTPPPTPGAGQSGAGPAPGFLKPVGYDDESFKGAGGFKTRSRLVNKPPEVTLNSFALPVFANGVPRIDVDGTVQEGQRLPLTFPTAKDRDDANAKLENLRKIGVPIAGIAQLIEQSKGSSIKPELQGQFKELADRYNALAGQEATGTSRIGKGDTENPLTLPYINPLAAAYTKGQVDAILREYASEYRTIIRQSDGHYDYNTKTFYH